MLPPVLASANTYAAVTEARQRPDQVTSQRLAPGASAAASTPLAQNSAVAGQLNIMLLSAPERMSQNLAALAEVLGTALKIERRADETLSDYMGRLVEGIANLPVGDRLKLQKLLSQAFAGLQLRTLLEAMASPSGPERATLALYLELYRQSDRDGAMRSVISSYRELAGDGRSADPTAARRMAANYAGRPLPDQPLPDRKAIQQPQGATEAAGSAVGSRSEPDPSLQGSPRAGGSDTAVPSRPVVTSAAPALPDAETAPEGPRPSPGSGPLETAQPRKTSRDASAGHEPSVVTAQAANDADTPRTGDPVTPSRVTIAGGVAGEGIRGSSTAERLQLPSVAAMSVPAAARPLLPLPAAWLAELLETDFVKALLQLKTLPPQIEVPTVATPNSDLAEPGAPSAPPDMAPSGEKIEEQAARATDPASPQDIEERSLPAPALLPDQAQIRPAISREGLPLPFISYSIDDDISTDGVEDEEERQDEQAGGRRNPQEESSEEAREPVDVNADASGGAEEGTSDTAAALLQPAALDDGDALRAALPSLSQNPVSIETEPAHQLYLRMAGLT